MFRVDLDELLPFRGNIIFRENRLHRTFIHAQTAVDAGVRIDKELIDRCEFVAGDFFETVPGDGDAYFLRNIIHDWQDDRAAAILATCRRAMPNHARLVLVERYLPDDPREALLVRHADLEMLVNVGGRERTTEEYASLLARSGLNLARTIPLGSAPEAMGHYLIEAIPA